MTKISGSEIKPGKVIEYEGSLWVAVKSVAVKPGKGPAYNQVELKNLLDGRKLNQRFGTDERVEETHVERKTFQFLYRQDKLVFMDMESYEQIEIEEDFVGERALFLHDGMTVTVELHQDRPIGVRLPEHVVLAVAEADAVIKGQTAASSYKNATLENGLRILVPPFITAGEKVVVNTNDVAYVKRAD